MEDVKKKLPAQTNPVVALFAIITASLILFGVSYIAFINSDAKRVVASIQNSSEIDNDVNIDADIDSTSEVSESALELIEKQIDDDVLPLDETADFNASELNDAALGL